MEENFFFPHCGKPSSATLSGGEEEELSTAFEDEKELWDSSDPSAEPSVLSEETECRKLSLSDSVDHKKKKLHAQREGQLMRHSLAETDDEEYEDGDEEDEEDEEQAVGINSAPSPQEEGDNLTKLSATLANESMNILPNEPLGKDKKMVYTRMMKPHWLYD